MAQTIEAPKIDAGVAERRRPLLTLAALWAFVAVFVPVVSALEAQLSTIDLAYHIRTGDLILDTGSFVRSDMFTYTAVGREWLNQQWGAQALFALVFRAGGWEALAILRAALVGFIFLFAFWASRAAGATLKRAAWFTLASYLLTLGGLGLRPQLFGMMLFAATVWILMDRHGAPRRLWAIPVMVAFWANLHGSFFMAPLMVGLFWFEDRVRRHPDAGRLLWVGVASLGASLLNPLGLRVWEYVWELSSNDIVTGIIQEWQPPTVREVPGAIFFVSVAAAAAILARRGRPTPWAPMLTLGVLYVIGLFAVRGIFWWAIVAPPVLAGLLWKDSPAPEDHRPGSMLMNRTIAVGLVALAVVFLPWWRGDVPLSPTTPLLDEAPAGITRYLQNNLGPGERLFNAQIWGSWFEFILPENPVFSDSRIEVIPARIWGDYRDISRGREGWKGLLDKWQVDVVVADKGQQGDLIPIIRRDPDWREAYKDKDGSVFLRADR